jgi:hypothetical protein
VGKNQCTAATLVPYPLHKHLDFLVDHREEFNVLRENPYLFAQPGTLHDYIDGYDHQKWAAEHCGAEKPKSLTSKGFRRLAVTNLDVSNLNSNFILVVTQIF